MVDEESWKKHVGEGENREAGSMMNRPAEEGEAEEVKESRTRPGC